MESFIVISGTYFHDSLITFLGQSTQHFCALSLLNFIYGQKQTSNILVSLIQKFIINQNNFEINLFAFGIPRLLIYPVNQQPGAIHTMYLGFTNSSWNKTLYLKLTISPKLTERSIE